MFYSKVETLYFLKNAFFSTGGLKIYRHVDLKIRQTSFEAELLKLKDHKENEHEIEMEEKKEKFQDIDKDDR